MKMLHMLNLLQKELSTAYPQADFQIVQADFSAQDGAELLVQQVRTCLCCRCCEWAIDDETVDGNKR